MSFSQILSMVIGLLLMFSLTELPPGFRVFAIWVSLVGFLYLALRATLSRRYLIAVLWLACAAWVQPFLRLPLDDTQWTWSLLIIAILCFGSLVFDEIANQNETKQAAQRAQTEGPQAKRKVPPKA